MSVVTLRHATLSDAPEIAKMLEHLADTLGDRDAFSTTGEIIAKHGFGERPMFEVIIAQEGETAVGFALFFPHFSTTRGQPGVYVQDLWIDPNQRGGGIGERLLAAVASYSEKTWSAGYMKLAVHDDNPRAKQFYLRLGLDESTSEIPMITSAEAFNALRGAV